MRFNVPGMAAVATCLCLPLVAAAVSRKVQGASCTAADRNVVLRYELLLKRCKGRACTVSSSGKGDVWMELDPESRSFAWDEEGTTVHFGAYAYYLRFKASCRLTRNAVKRAIDIGFGGRVETPSENRQVTFADKLFLFTNRDWAIFPQMSVTGTAYQEGAYSTTPTLRVTIAPPTKPVSPRPR